VVSSAPALKSLTSGKRYRDAVLGADFAIADSALMVRVWNLIQRNRITKLSGLKYLRLLMEQPEVREPPASFWVMLTPSIGYFSILSGKRKCLAGLHTHSRLGKRIHQAHMAFL
jgi:hypothetical protein